MSTLERAIAIAAEAHAGQVDKAGTPYVLHPLRVMLGLSSTDERVVAVLHDVCEDCPGWSFDRLRSEGFSNRIIDALQSVTKRDAEGYRRLCAPLSRQPDRPSRQAFPAVCMTTAIFPGSPRQQSETCSAPGSTDERST